ncbi:GumC family protein [Sphaerotilus uruguayifluvii]|uniref:non-specific protein-tyrosine kinase n=1 Tax=Sphaerotilus uruguayifluvii TaxID=2735897 RepID=A0ABX2G7H7_9BURK|nr:polysaccharide biosynthesis tyrosine autokinase [Leptothrix sp. C29]NRT58273.1 capsular exopolysaccharide synthesis family protein [Leptothrix sp. C29]
MNQIQVAAQGQVPAQPAPPFAPVQIGLSEESKLALLDHWRSIKKRRWPILGLATALAALGAAVAFSMTPVYRSTATVLIEAGKPKFLSMDDMIGSAMQSKEQYQTQVEILKSREVAQRTVTALKLWNNPDFDPRKGEAGLSHRLKAMLGKGAAPTEWDDEKLAEAVVEPFMKAVTVEPVRLSQLVKVSFDSPDSRLAARVANELSSNYIDADRDAKFKLAQNLNGWLEKRATELRKNLEESELALQAYREEKGLVSLSGSAQALAGMQANEVTQRLIEARARRMQLEGTYNLIGGVSNGDYSNIPAVVNHPSVQEAIRQEAAAQKEVAELSENLGPNHVKMQEAQSSLAAARKYLEQQRRSIARSMVQEYNLARQSEKSLETALGAATGGVQDVNRKEFQLQVLEREVSSNKQLYDLFMSRAKEMDAGSDIQAAIARIVDPAVVAKDPVRPNKGQIIIVAFVLGLMIGSMGALMLERMDNTIKGSESAETKLQQPVLAVLPALKGEQLENVATLFIREPNSHHAEAIRTARTGIQLSDVDQRHRLIMLTSSVPAEGKTSTSINLALALAQTKRTLLIDADMRRPQVGVRLGMAPNAKGLSNLVTGTASLKECVHQVEGSPLLVMPAGDIPPNPLDLLLSQRFKDAIRHLQPQLDFILIDTPPVELVSDALSVAPMATSTIYVVRATETPVPVVRKGLSRLQRAGAHVMGVIVNGLDFEDAQRYYGESVNGGYGNTYYHGYVQQQPTETEAKA